MKKISSKNNFIYRLELVSENKFKIMLIMLKFLILYCRCGSPSPFPLSPPCPGDANIASPQKKIPYLLLKHLKTARHI